MQPQKILLAVCGSIAAYKSVFLLRLLKKAGFEVKVIMTNSAKQFVGPLTFSTLSENTVLDNWINELGTWTNHVELGLWADLLLIAPATAQTIAKLSYGLADDLLGGVYLSAKCPVMMAPAMDLDMWIHPATQRNIHQLQSDGVIIIEPDSGALASGLEGKGRMQEPDFIFEYILSHFKNAS